MRRARNVTLPLPAAAERVDETISKLLGGDEVNEEVDGVRAVSQKECDLQKERKNSVVQWETIAVVQI